MKRFDYLAPNSLAEAVELLAARPEATPLAGGTNILVQLKEGQRTATTLLSLKRVPEVHHLKDDGRLVIGSAVTVKQVATDPTIRRRYSALATAAGLIGSVQTRNMATIGGNICNASPSADTAPPLLVFDAQAVLVSTQGERTIPLTEFFIGPGQTALKPGELLKEIIIPGHPARVGSAYARHIPRRAMDISVVGVAAALTLDEEGRIGLGRIALGAVAPVPMRAREAEVCLQGRLPSADLWSEVGQKAAQEAAPVDDIRATVAYRRHLIEILTQDALRGALANITESSL